MKSKDDLAKEQYGFRFGALSAWAQHDVDRRFAEMNSLQGDSLSSKVARIEEENKNLYAETIALRQLLTDAEEEIDMLKADMLVRDSEDDPDE